MSAKRAVGMVLVALGWSVGSFAQADLAATPAPPDVARVVVTLREMSERLRLTLHLAALGVVSPTQADLRLYAGLVVNFLVGPGGDGFNPRLGPDERFTGLLPAARSLADLPLAAEVPPELRDRLAVALRKVGLLLAMAREETILALRARRMDVGADRMLRAFAFLSAALGRETDPVHLGGVLALLRILAPVSLPPADGGP